VSDNNLTRRVIEGYITAPYYWNFLEYKLSLHLEDLLNVLVQTAN
jgi:hypothetical protein